MPEEPYTEIERITAEKLNKPPEEVREVVDTYLSTLGNLARERQADDA